MENQHPQQSWLSSLIELFRKLFTQLFNKKPQEFKPDPEEPIKDASDNNNTTPPNLPDPPSDPQPLQDQVSFVYGGKEITLTKSTKFIAFKTDEGVTPAMARVILPNEQMYAVGEFRLIGPVPRSFDNVDATLENVRAMPGVEIGTHVFHGETKEDTPIIPSGEIFIIFKENVPWADCEITLNKYFLTIKEKRAHREYIVKVTKASPNPIKVTISLQQSGIVDIAEPDLISPVGLTALNMPADELLKDQWHLQNKGKHGKWHNSVFKVGADAKVVQAWEKLQNLGSSDIVVAVIDSGFDLTHPDLRGNGGKIVAPWDFETNTNDPSPHLGDWHGTACAGIAIGDANGTGIVGAAPNARFMPLRFWFISDSQIENWFEYASKNGADVISNSWGSQSAGFVMSTRMIRAITKCATQGRNGKGCVICFASGNSGRNISDIVNPTAVQGFATHPNVIAVGASNSKDEWSAYSNYGYQLTVCAPSNGSGGAGVTTADVGGTLTFPDGSLGYKGYDATDYTTGFGGTSSACPLVAGICALILSANPDLTAKEVKEILKTTSDKIGKSTDYINGHSIYFGYGRINAYKAVQKALGVQPIDEPDNPPLPPVDDNNNPPPIVINQEDIRSLPFEALRGGAMQQAGTEHIYKFSLGRQLTIKTDAPLGDNPNFDLYVKRNGLPNPENEDFDANSKLLGSTENVVFNQPLMTDYYALVKATSGEGGYILEAILDTQTTHHSIEALPLTAAIGGILMEDRIPEMFYKISLGNQIIVELDSPVGDNNNFDIYLKRGKIPKWNDYDGRGITKSSDEKIVLNSPESGDYYILIRSQKGAGGYNLKVTVS